MATNGFKIASIGNQPPHTVTETADEKSLRSGNGHNGESRTFVDINRHFDGAYHWYEGRHYKNPTPQDVGLQAPLPPSELTRHRDILGRITQRPKDVLRYVSPTDGKASHMLVQATPQAFQSAQGDWRRVRLGGTAPTLLRLSVWALGDGEDKLADFQEILWIAAKVFVTIPLQFFRLSWPFTRSRTRTFFYPTFPSRSWDYPKYARNPLDASPLKPLPVIFNGASYNIAGEQHRLLQPRKMIISIDGKWVLTDGTPQPYIVISYTTQAGHFPKDDEPALNRLRQIAEKMAEEENVKAYWVDYQCRAEQQPELTDDVHRICDVFRGARRVCVVLPDLTLERKRQWGMSLWTVPEVLLSASDEIKFCALGEKSQVKTEVCTKIELAASVWTDGEVTRRLAEHYTGTLTLSRLELISLGLKALISRRQERPFTPGDVAYSLMSLLNYRPRMNPEDNLFQALARLSLANDSDRIVERMVCLLPDLNQTRHTTFVLEDTLGAQLWDVEPLCQVAGVGEGNEIILDGCKAVSIRWKDIPRIEYDTRLSWKKRGAIFSLQSGSYWFIIGVALASSGSQTGNTGLEGFGIFLLLVGVALIIAAPWSIKAIYGGKVWGQSPWLVGFEGVLPINEIERMTFGNAIGRLKYAPSSNLHSERDDFERIGKGPTFIERPGSVAPPVIPAGHRIFTLIDTGSLTVSVFTAERPPSAALILGKEGGMLRVVLCSYERSNNTLHKETVLRMETPMLDKAVLHGWLKLT